MRYFRIEKFQTKDNTFEKNDTKKSNAYSGKTLSIVAKHFK